jgi:hypothetical protein
MMACVGESYRLLQRALLLGPFGLPALVALAGFGAYRVLVKQRDAGRFGRQFERLSLFLAALLALFLVHTWVRLSFREWYTSPFVPGVALLIGLNVEWIARRIGQQTATVVAILLLVWPLYRGYTQWRTEGFGRYLRDTPAPRAPAPLNRTAHTDCGLSSYYATYGVSNLDGLVNQRAYEALRDRRLLSYIREQRFTEFGLARDLRSAAFLGGNYRESVISLSDHSLRVVEQPDEKNERLRPRVEPYRLATLAGREFLGDGWIWPRETEKRVKSIGPASELVFYLPSRRTGGEAVLRARAVTVGPGGTQPTTLRLNGRLLKTVEVSPKWSSLVIPLTAARPGRNRLRLDYAAPQPVRDKSPGWYRSLRGNPVTAVEVSTLSLPPP